MQLTDKQRIEEIKADFEMLWCCKVQSLTQLRGTKMSQSDMAYLCDKSLKTIQRFENYQSKDPELMYIYSKQLNQEK